MNRPITFLHLLGGFVIIAGPAFSQDAAALRQAISAAPATAPAILSQVLRSAGPNVGLVAAPDTAAAIAALGAEATNKQISALVYAAVRIAPDSAVKIVRAAVAVAPDAAPEIAAAAVRAVPNPWKEVRYQREEQPANAPAQTTPDFFANNDATSVANTGSPKEPDFKSIVDNAFQDGVEAILDPAAPGDPMTLAEAIVQAASDPHTYAKVQTAVDGALFGRPGSLAGDPRGTSGIGTAGNSNYANEPFKPSQPPGGDPPGGNPPPSSPPVTPNPPPVSP